MLYQTAHKDIDHFSKIQIHRCSKHSYHKRLNNLSDKVTETIASLKSSALYHINYQASTQATLKHFLKI